MQTSTITLHIPEVLARHVPNDARDLDERVTEALALHLYQTGHLSLGRAAEILDLDADAFRHLLAIRGIPYFNQDIEAVLRDAVVAASLGERQAE